MAAAGVCYYPSTNYTLLHPRIAQYCFLKEMPFGRREGLHGIMLILFFSYHVPPYSP